MHVIWYCYTLLISIIYLLFIVRTHKNFDTESLIYKVGQFVGFIRATTQQGVLANVLCNKDNVTLDQMQLIVAKYFKNNPERWQDPATLLILEALNEAFCK